MIDENKLLKEIKNQIKNYRNFWLYKASKYAETEDEMNIDICDGKLVELEIVMKMIQEQPKADEWIPCSERLPEDTSNYLVTVMIGSPFGAYKEVRSAIYNIKTGWYVYKNTDEVVAVIAWKEPSEPWKGEADGK